MIDLIRILSRLAEQRPLFHAEADFQHALAWEIQRQLSDADLRLEVPYSREDRREHIDIILNLGGEKYAIELKYKTKKLWANVRGEEFNLRDQHARDIGRYDFIKDIVRLEHRVMSNVFTGAFAAILTNDNNYWSSNADGSTVDAAFRIEENRKLAGKLAWSPDASEGTTAGRKSPLELSNSYSCKWTDYSLLVGEGAKELRYLLLEISP